jgi:hypothetical protein
VPSQVWDYAAAVTVIGEDVLRFKVVHGSPKNPSIILPGRAVFWASVKLKFAARPHELPKFFS